MAIEIQKPVHVCPVISYKSMLISLPTNYSNNYRHRLYRGLLLETKLLQKERRYSMYCTKVTWFEFAADRKCKCLVNISQHFVVENVAVFGKL